MPAADIEIYRSIRLRVFITLTAADVIARIARQLDERRRGRGRRRRRGGRGGRGSRRRADWPFGTARGDKGRERESKCTHLDHVLQPRRLSASPIERANRHAVDQRGFELLGLPLLHQQTVELR